jgi:hypothetical protein
MGALRYYHNMDTQLGDYFFLTCFDIARLSAGRFVQPPENETGLTTRLAAIVRVKQIHPVTATRAIRFSAVHFFCPYCESNQWHHGFCRLDSPVFGWDLFRATSFPFVARFWKINWAFRRTQTYTRRFGEALLRQGFTNANRITILWLWFKTGARLPFLFAGVTGWRVEWQYEQRQRETNPANRQENQIENIHGVPA